MGKGTIQSGGTDGLYTIKLDFGKTERDAKITKIDQKLSEINAEIAKWLHVYNKCTMPNHA